MTKPVRRQQWRHLSGIGKSWLQQQLHQHLTTTVKCASYWCHVDMHGFYARQHVMLRASWPSSRCLLLCPSVRPSHRGTVSKRRHLESITKSLLGLPQRLVTLGEAVEPSFLKCLPLLACTTWKRLQIGTDMLLIITSLGDELHMRVNIDDLERL